MIDMESLFRSNGIRIASSGDRHYRHGWINTPCPFCTGNDGNHLGWSVAQQYFVCIRCGWHPTDKVLTTLIPHESSLASILAEHRKKLVLVSSEPSKAHATVCKLPMHIDKLSMPARQYLRRRRFNPSRLEDLWELKSGRLTMQGRIIAPIYLGGRLVSYQTRDVTDKARLRYITCSMEDEVVHHKHTIYGIDQIPTDSIVVVEGITDVWRLGFGAGGTFGIKYTEAQVKVLATMFRNRFVLFDTVDRQARWQGRKLAEQLSSFDGNTEYIELGGRYRRCDPAELPQSYADSLMRELK